MPSPKPPFDRILWCDVKSLAATARLLSVERFDFDGDNVRAHDTLVVPEDFESPIQSSQADRFFMHLADSSGYLFVNRDPLSNHREWQRVSGFIAKCPLVDIALLRGIFFPNVSAADLTSLEELFAIPSGTTPAQAVRQIAAIVVARARSLPGSTLRALRTVFRGLPQQYQDWLGAISALPAADAVEIDSRFEISLDRFENFTNGIALTDRDVLLLFSDAQKLAEKIEGYEPRAGQAKYVQAVLKTIEQKGVILLEAATGTGKSIGYLLPTVASCAAGKQRAVIVTRTKSLQEQLFRSDLQKIRTLIPDGFRISLLKGLSNYLCKLKYKLFLSDLAEVMGKVPAEQMATLFVWEHLTESGDLTETTIFDQPDSDTLMSKVTLDEGACLGKACQFYNECYAFRARRQAAKSDLVITNYALLFADIVGTGDILGRFAYAIFDEAHRLEAEAINAFAETVAFLALARGLERLTNDNNRPLLDLIVDDEDVTLSGLTGKATRLATHVKIAAEDIRRLLRHVKSQPGERVRFRVGDPIHAALSELWHSERDTWLEFRDQLIHLQQGLTGSVDDEQAEGITLLRRLVNVLVKYTNLLERIPEADAAADVLWGLTLDSGEVWITRAPLKVGELLAQRLYPRYDAMIMTSATLDSEDNFEWIAGRLGLTAANDIRPFRVKIKSPFPLDRQLRIALARYLPAPNTPEYVSRLANLIMRLRAAIRLPTLVLCTSYRMVEELARPLQAQVAKVGEVLAQTPDTLPQTLLNRFKQARNAMLIGTESFWEGIDLPDELLRVLFITRLPFAVPDDPLELARQELAESHGQNAFMTVSLPQAVLKYRQGIGRMIRSKTDWGVVIVTDSRMGRKNYGQILFAASPVEINVFDNEAQLVTEIGSWLKKQN